MQKFKIMKNIFILALSCCFILSCSKDDEVVVVQPDPTVESLINAPYSSLSPENQKLKLESDAKNTITELETLQTSSAIAAMLNLDRLLKISNIDILNGKVDNGIQEIINLADAYGIYTWNNTLQAWVKTSSTGNLTFKFPSKKTGVLNNADFSTTAIASTVSVEIVDTPVRYQYQYNPQTGTYNYVLISQEVLDNLKLPLSVNGTIKIDNTQSGTVTQTNTFGTTEVPLTSKFNLSTNDGYVFDFNTNKQTNPAVSDNKITFNGKNIYSLNIDTTSKIDALLDGSDLYTDYGKANMMYTLLNNFVILGLVDTANFTNQQQIDENSLTYPNYNTSAYYTNLNIYRKKLSELNATAQNTHIKLALVSKTDKTKIADIVVKSELDGYYFNNLVWQNGYWTYSNNTAGQRVERYKEVYYLKFNDNTLVAANVYFSTGFDTLTTKFNAFINGF